jgi:hypothetical protein
MSKEAKERRLRTLTVSVGTFEAVIAACEFLLKDGIDPNAPYFRTFGAGIVVSYMRPFVQGDGLSALPKFEEFPSNPELKALHEDLKKGRDFVFAHHSDIDSSSLLPEDKQENAKNIELHFDDNGYPVRYVVKPIQWNRDRLHAIISLCKFQAQRMVDAAMLQMKHLAGDKTYRGTHILGKTFP